MNTQPLNDPSIAAAHKPFAISEGEFSMQALNQTRQHLSAEVASLADTLGRVANTLQHFGRIRVARRTRSTVISCQIDSRELGTVVAGHGLFSEHPKQRVGKLLSSL